jgi:hypothetical protein
MFLELQLSANVSRIIRNLLQSRRLRADGELTDPDVNRLAVNQIIFAFTLGFSANRLLS